MSKRSKERENLKVDFGALERDLYGEVIVDDIDVESVLSRDIKVKNRTKGKKDKLSNAKTIARRGNGDYFNRGKRFK